MSPELESRLRAARPRIAADDAARARVAEALGLGAAPREARSQVARGRHWTRLRSARLALACVAAAVIALGATLAVPQGRAALGAAFDRFASFFDGADAPGEPIRGEDPDGPLNWLGDATPGSPRVLARSGSLRLVGFRDAGTGHACFSLGRSVTECGDADHWRMRLAGGAVVPILTTRGRSADEVALWGVTADAVASVELRYRDGTVIRTLVGTNGFVIAAPEGPPPVALVARDEGGAALATADVTDLQWRFCEALRGCPDEPGSG